jgi:release factor glutamine methyltransferase
MLTLRELIAEGTATLSAARVEQAPRTASLLVRELLDLELSTIIAFPERPVSDEDATRVRAALARRAAGEPLQYITGHQEFYGLEFTVTPDVLIPRPETEHIIEAVLEHVREKGMTAPRILDVGTGSGCIAVTLAVNLPSAHVTAVDISPAALDVARANAARHRVTDRMTFLESDFLSVFNEDHAIFDVVVSNPPYIPEEQFEGLQREVRDHEPYRALIGGIRGTEAYEVLLRDVPALLAPGGVFICEIGFGQAERIVEIGDAAGWTCGRIIADLQGIERTLAFHRPT